MTDADPTSSPAGHGRNPPPRLEVIGRGGRHLGPGVRTWPVTATEVSGIVEACAASKLRFADLFGRLVDGHVVLHAVYADDRNDEYVLLEWPVAGEELTDLSTHTPAAFVEECEVYEQFAIRPASGRSLNRVVAPPFTERHFARLGRSSFITPRGVRAPHYVTGEAIEFPSGPVRGVGQESLYMGLVTSGEELIDLYLLYWHKHRGIERRLEGLSPQQALFLVERTEGLSAVGNGWSFCRAVETLMEAQVPEPVERARGVALELERLYNHAAAVAALCQATGLSVGQAQAEIVLERALRLNAAALGHRYLFGFLAVGGVARALDAESLRTELPAAVDELRRLLDRLLSTNSFMDRLEATGIVPAGAATELGLVGPVARASAQTLDCRRDHPFGPYRGMEWQAAIGERGDVLSRFLVMQQEIESSTRLISDLLAAGVGTDRPNVRPAAPEAALGWCESSRGEALAWVSLDKQGIISRARLRPASVRNWRAFDDAARSRNVFTDIPIIEASFWLTVAGMAR